MTTIEYLNWMFETQFNIWEKNRMYPPNHTGDKMITLSNQHLMAIARGIHFVRSGITDQMTTKLVISITKDIELMHEVHKYILQQIKEPGLPMTPENIGQGNNGEKDGHSDKPSTG